MLGESTTITLIYSSIICNNIPLYYDITRSQMFDERFFLTAERLCYFN